MTTHELTQLPKLRPTVLDVRSGRETRKLNRQLARKRFGKKKFGFKY